ncbi:hypothetical protein K438DRAFT_2113697 [Mycena galopus ATCC 62051]|nr:hypothetical protein K438DRAFT_1788292 [Mycena galopus ATCC 62051]KAF8142386.1 hypothetical protein K438DRAFT_2113697 [Mycena galopus ATCC 62051]
MQLYPEVEDMAQGSLDKLFDICRLNRPIHRSELGKLRRFSLAYQNEAEKLLKGNAQVVNKQLVEWILATLDDSFASELEQAMNQQAIAAFANPVPNPAGGPLRRGDKMPYESVLKIADYIADNWSGRSAMAELMSSGRTASTATSPFGGSSSGFIPSAKVKTEHSERFETFANELAQMKDLALLQEKRFQENFKKMEGAIENSVKLLNQSIRGPPPHMEIQQAGQSLKPEDRALTRDLRRGGSGGGPCYFCSGPHFVRECIEKDEYISLGWILIDNGLIKLGNGGWIPKFPESSSRKDKVDEHYRKLGMTKGTSGAKQGGRDTFGESPAVDREVYALRVR